MQQKQNHTQSTGIKSSSHTYTDRHKTATGYISQEKEETSHVARTESRRAYAAGRAIAVYQSREDNASDTDKEE